MISSNPRHAVDNKMVKDEKFQVGKTIHVGKTITSSKCFMLLAKDLSITWGEDKRYWQWISQKEPNSDKYIEVAELLNVCWLEVTGKFHTTKLSPGIAYEISFVIMLKDPSHGWEVPANFKLILPDGSQQEHEENLKEKPRGQWIEIPTGFFIPSVANCGQMEFSMYEYGGHWKKGLLVKGVVIRPNLSK